MSDAAVREWQRECAAAPSIAALEGLDAARRRTGDGPYLPVRHYDEWRAAQRVAEALHGASIDWPWIVRVFNCWLPSSGPPPWQAIPDPT